MKKLYFIRHGLSELNVKGLYAGITDTPLTEEGRAQAKKTGQQAKEMNLRIDVIISSPLSRALETAQILAKEVNYPESKIIVDKRVIERNFGALEGKPWSPNHTDEYKQQMGGLMGGESEEALVARVRSALDWIESLSHDNILVVSHGATGRALRSLVRHDFPMSHPHRLGNAELHQWV